MSATMRGAICRVALLALLIPVVFVWGYDCVDQDITTVITLTPGGVHSLTRCHIHSGGQVVLTGGGTLTVMSSTVTAGWEGIPKIVVESVSSPLLFTLQDTNLTAPLPNISIQVLNLLKADSKVIVTNNTFGNMTDVHFMGVTTLEPTSAISIESNVVGNRAVGISDYNTEYVFIIQNISMAGGSLRVVSNTGAPLSGVPTSAESGDSYFLIYVRNLKLSAVESGSVEVSRNKGFYPVATIEVTGDFIASTPLPRLSIAIKDNEAYVGDVVVIRFMQIAFKQSSSSQGNISIEVSGNRIRHIVGANGNGCQLINLVEAGTFPRNYLNIRVVNNSLVARDQAAPYSVSAGMVLAMYYHDGEDDGISNIIADVSHNTQDIQVTGRSGLVSICTGLFFGHMRNSVYTSSYNNLTILGPGRLSAFLGQSNVLTFDNSSLTMMFNDVRISSSSFITFIYSDGDVVFANESTFTMSHNNLFITNTSYSIATSATYFGGTMNFTQNAVALFEISFNVVGGECDSSTYGIFTNSSDLGGFANTTKAMGCHNTVCGTYFSNLENSSSANALQWEYCPATTTTTTTPNTTTASPPAASKASITTYPDEPSSPTGLAVAGMATSTIGASLDSASSVQIMAMMSVMACRTDGEDEGTARLFLTPLRIDDTLASADLIGSIVLVVGVSAVYLAIAGLVMIVVRSRGPKPGDLIPDDENGSTYDEDGAAYAREKRVFRAKLFLFYPRVPMVVTTLLFPGIVFDSSSLLYGTLGLKATIGEQVLGGACFAACIGFCAYHVVAGVYAVRKIEQQDAVEDIAQTSKTIPQQNDEAAYSNPATPTPAPDEGEDGDVIVKIAKVDDIQYAAPDTTDITADPRSRMWFILYSDSDRGHHPRFLELLLLPDGWWNSVATQSWCGIVTSLKGAAWGAGRCSSHSLVRMLLISIVAAINPSTATGCDVVQSLVAAISFAHGALLLIARIYRIPVLNPLQGFQSVLVGLLALASFIDNVQAQSAFSTTLLVIAVLITVLSLLATLLEIRVQKKGRIQQAPPKKGTQKNLNFARR